MSTAVDQSPTERAREALDRHAWREAFDLMKRADRDADLGPEDLEVLGEAAWWVGEAEVSTDALERAYALYSKDGAALDAARAAVSIAYAMLGAGNRPVLAGWLGRAERLLQDLPETPIHAFFTAVKGAAAQTTGDLDTALELGTETLDIGTRTKEPDFMALGLHGKGRALVAMGRVDEGMALLDEATAAAVSGELSPKVTGNVYCSTVSACWTMGDYGRAGRWTEAAERWCRRLAINGFPGLCRVHRAQVMKLRGAWREAEGQALLAVKELPGWFPDEVGHPLYEIGEIRLRTGDLRGAEEAFRQAHEAGYEPQPGLSLLRLAQGNVEAAATGIRRALAQPSQRPTFEAPPNSDVQRALLLPAQVEIALAAEDLDTARTTTEELERHAATFDSTALNAAAAWARGSLQLRAGEHEDAQSSLNRSVSLWRKVDAPYETARVRMVLGDAYRAAGDEDQAVLEYRAALSAFDRLGAGPDARRASDALGGETAVGDPGERLFRAFVFTDIVGSTDLGERIGDEAFNRVIRRHDQAVRTLVAAFGGEVVKFTGDGFFLTFERTSDAFECAAAIQRDLEEERRKAGFAVEVRIGVHAAEATRERNDYRGSGVNTAARIGALAEGGEILSSIEAAAGAPPGLPTSPPRTVTLKGIAEPVEVVSVAWRASEPAPPEPARA